MPRQVSQLIADVFVTARQQMETLRALMTVISNSLTDKKHFYSACLIIITGSVS